MRNAVHGVRRQGIPSPVNRAPPPAGGKRSSSRPKTGRDPRPLGDRTIAEWLNAKGAKTGRGTRFQADAIREMLLNASYCGYVTGLLRQLVIDAIQAEARARAGDQPDRRRELLSQLERLQDLYVMGDLSRGQYTMRRQALEQEVERVGPPVDPDLDRAEKLLDEFASFWEAEQEPAERRKLLGQLFDRIWQDGGTIVAVKPRTPFARYFQTVAEIQEIDREIPGTPTGDPGCRKRERRGSNPPHLTPRVEIRR